MSCLAQALLSSLPGAVSVSPTILAQNTTNCTVTTGTGAIWMAHSLMVVTFTKVIYGESYEVLTSSSMRIKFSSSPQHPEVIHLPSPTLSYLALLPLTPGGHLTRNPTSPPWPTCPLPSAQAEVSGFCSTIRGCTCPTTKPRLKSLEENNCDLHILPVVPPS